MERAWIITICCMIIAKTSGEKWNNLRFPRGFKFGAATSAFQIEGAWNVSFKGLSIWDAWTHERPQEIIDHSNPDVACNSYYKYKEDVQLVKDIGLDYYRFSISWPRVLPSGLPNVVCQDGLQYYKNLVDECLAQGIEPVVTIYHFDHPELLEDMGGWINDRMVDWFVDYARVIFKELGPKVKIFVTINEPQQLCKGYQSEDMMAPGKPILDIGVYRCLHNILKAHARAYHMYDKEFRKSQNGLIGFTNPCGGYLPVDPNDGSAAEIAFQFFCGIVSHPIYIGDYPPIVKERVAKISKAQGYKESRLPEFSPEWVEYIKGTADYFGLNHYSSMMYDHATVQTYGEWNSDSGIIAVGNDSWSGGSAVWVKVVPEGFSHLLRKIKKEYNNPPLFVMENGYPDYGEVEDYDRINYHYLYLKELLKAIKQYGCNILRYTIWSLLDNFELNAGYTQPFGIIRVDFNDDDRPRTRKLSSVWWEKVLWTHQLQDVPNRVEKTE